MLGHSGLIDLLEESSRQLNMLTLVCTELGNHANLSEQAGPWLLSRVWPASFPSQVSGLLWQDLSQSETRACHLRGHSTETATVCIFSAK